MHTVNLGIVAHVDAGKTSLTERLLFAAGVIDKVGRVDEGTTQTDSLALERRRGISIKSAVASFAVDDVTVNLIDTPGHPEFVAEVERVLNVLDGAVLVVSAVEGVQPQTRVLMRTLRRLRTPTLIFVNKIDRSGADAERVLRSIGERLTETAIAMGSVSGAGGRAAAFTPHGAGDPDFRARLAELLAEHDDALLAAYVHDEDSLTYQGLRGALAAQTRRVLAHPVFFGSAVTGAGVDHLAAGVRELLPTAGGEQDGPAWGRVFKIERGRAGEKIAYVRVFGGTLRTRERLRVGRAGAGKVSAISVYDGGPARPSATLTAGQIGKLWGLPSVGVGDTVGQPPPALAPPPRHFAPPTLETVVSPRRPADRRALHEALAQLAEQDPLINLRLDDARHEVLVSLYGEVHKEVIQATLAADYGVEAEFGESTTICVERPAGAGAAAEFIDAPANPFRATIGLRVAPAAAGAGVRFGLEIEPGALPAAFLKAIEEAVRHTLRQGIYGWQVIDCSVALTHSGYVPPPPTGWSNGSSSGGDFRNLTPLVLMSALKQAGTTVCEPVHRFRLEIPAPALAAVSRVLARLRAAPAAPAVRGGACVLAGHIPAASVHELRLRLPGLTGGDGTLESEFDHYQPVRGPAPVQPRLDRNPLDRKEYLLRVSRPGGAPAAR